jgi:hypothetical protein
MRSLIAVIVKLFTVINLTTFRKDMLSPTSGIGTLFFLRIGGETERTGPNLHKYKHKYKFNINVNINININININLI